MQMTSLYLFHENQLKMLWKYLKKLFKKYFFFEHRRLNINADKIEFIIIGYASKKNLCSHADSYIHYLFSIL